MLGQAAAGPLGDAAVLELQRQVAEARAAELQGQVEAMVEQLGSSADESVVALEKEVAEGFSCWVVAASSAGYEVYATLQSSREFLSVYSWRLCTDPSGVILEKVVSPSQSLSADAAASLCDGTRAGGNADLDMGCSAVLGCQAQRQLS